MDNLKIKLLLIIACVLSACDKSIQIEPQLPLNEPRPDYIPFLAPSPQEVIALSDYRNGGHDDPSGPVLPSNGRNSICAEIIPEPLLEPGDFFALRPNQGEYFPDRITLHLDGEIMPLNGEVNTVLGTYKVYDDKGEIIAEAPGPHNICWSAEVGTGNHVAAIEIKKTSGAIIAYRWSFEIIDGVPPTSTPFPTPTRFDAVGALPVYIKAVFPPPGKTIIGSESNLICVSFDKQALLALDETLPTTWFRLNEYTFFQVDDMHISLLPRQINEDEVAGLNISHLDMEEFQTNCAELDLPPGRHTAISYFVPPHTDMVTYGWSFTIAED